MEAFPFSADIDPNDSLVTRGHACALPTRRSRVARMSVEECIHDLLTVAEIRVLEAI
jgi:hypothetical protein